jgi:hypothetical protein
MSAGLLTTTPLVMAQAKAADAPAAQAAPRVQHMHRHDGARRAHLTPTQRTEARLAYIRTALTITDAQRPQWDAFADVLRNQAKQREDFVAKRRAEHAQGAQKEKPRFSAIDRLERREKMMQFASKRLDEVITAAKPLYAALTPEQQQIADSLIAREGHGWHGHRGGMRHGMHHKA